MKGISPNNKNSYNFTVSNISLKHSISSLTILISLLILIMLETVRNNRFHSKSGYLTWQNYNCLLWHPCDSFISRRIETTCFSLWFRHSFNRHPHKNPKWNGIFAQGGTQGGTQLCHFDLSITYGLTIFAKILRIAVDKIQKFRLKFTASTVLSELISPCCFAIVLFIKCFSLTFHVLFKKYHVFLFSGTCKRGYLSSGCGSKFRSIQKRQVVSLWRFCKKREEWKYKSIQSTGILIN